MKCTNCGNKLKEGVKFCTHCGTPVNFSFNNNEQENINVNNHDYYYDNNHDKKRSKLSTKAIVGIVISAIVVIGVIITIVVLNNYNNTKISNAYSTVVNNYIKSVNNGGVDTKTKNVDATIINNYLSGDIASLYYSVCDIDDDGTDDLLIATTNDNGKYVVLAAYSYKDNGVYSLTINTNSVPTSAMWSLLCGGGTTSSSKEATTVAEPLNKQIVRVKASGSTATLTLEQWSDGTWKTLMNTNAYIGTNGITTDKTEGDKCTPAGKFDILFAFSTYDLSNKTKIETKKVYSGNVWVTDSSSEYYNTYQYSNTGNWNDVDNIFNNFSQNKSYACIAFAFNGDCETLGSATSKKGSAIWIDGYGSNGNPTSGYGDVKITADDMATLLSYLDKSMNPQIVIE